MFLQWVTLRIKPIMYVNPLALCQAHHQDSKFGQQYYYLVITINFKELEPFGVKKKKRPYKYKEVTIISNRICTYGIN